MPEMDALPPWTLTAEHFNIGKGTGFTVVYSGNICGREAVHKIFSSSINDRTETRMDCIISEPVHRRG